MSVMIFESQAPVELVPTWVEVIRLQMHGFDSEFAASLHREIDRSATDSLLPSFRSDIKLIDETITPVKLKRKSEAQHHIANYLLRVFEKNQSTETLVFDQL